MSSRVLLLAGVNQRYVFTVGSVAELVFIDPDSGEEMSLPVSEDQAARVLAFCVNEDEDGQVDESVNEPEAQGAPDVAAVRSLREVTRVEEEPGDEPPRRANPPGVVRFKKPPVGGEQARGGSVLPGSPAEWDGHGISGHRI